jgi:hypothetical protein
VNATLPSASLVCQPRKDVVVVLPAFMVFAYSL